MTPVTLKGKTFLKGHGLRYEGYPRFDVDGRALAFWQSNPGYAKCECGALSPPGQSMSANRRWHRAHKDSLR